MNFVFVFQMDSCNHIELTEKLDDLAVLVQSKEAEIEKLRVQLIEQDSKTQQDQDETDKDAIIEHLELRLRETEDNTENFIEKSKQIHILFEAGRRLASTLHQKIVTRQKLTSFNFCYSEK